MTQLKHRLGQIEKHIKPHADQIADDFADQIYATLTDDTLRAVIAGKTHVDQVAIGCTLRDALTQAERARFADAAHTLATCGRAFDQMSDAELILIAVFGQA